MYVTFGGESGRETASRKLDNPTKDDFNRGKTDTFHIKTCATENVGNLVNVTIDLKRGNAWILDDVRVF